MGKERARPTAVSRAGRRGLGVGCGALFYPRPSSPPLGAVESFFPAAAVGPDWAVGLAGCGAFTRVQILSTTRAHTARR